MLNEEKHKQEFQTGGSSNDNMASDFGTPQSQVIKDGSSFISKGCHVQSALSPGFIDFTLSNIKYCGNSVIDGVLESTKKRVEIDYKFLCIRVCAFYR